MRRELLRGISITGLLCFAMLGCTNSSGTNGENGSTGSGGQAGQAGTTALPTGSGLCQNRCTRDCAADRDCDASVGELCCELGSFGKTCMKASDCPRFCADDSKCDSSKGQACARINLAIPQKMCASPTDALVLCGTDKDCGTSQVCCGIYKEPICLSPYECPTTCTQASDCATNRGEICCTTAKTMEPSLAASGLCLDPKRQPCPKACSQSMDCDTVNGELCCGGICSTSCPKTCKQSSDCPGQLCCKSAITRLPSETKTFSVGYSSSYGGSYGGGGYYGGGGSYGGGGGGSIGSGSDYTACTNLLNASCKRMMECPGLDIYTSVADCVSSASGDCSDPASLCNSGESFYAASARTCAAALPTAPCSVFSGDMTTYAPSCATVCM